MRRILLVTVTAVVAVLLASSLVIAQQQRQLDTTSGVLNTEIEPQSHEFSDVPTDSPFHSFVSWLVARGITGGCAAGLFCPDAPVTRAQMAVFMKVNSLRGSPLAFGMITDAALVGGGSGNFTATYNAIGNRYEIAIAGHQYEIFQFATLVTLVGPGCDGYTASTNSSNGVLTVRILDSGAIPATCSFHFATYYNGN